MNATTTANLVELSALNGQDQLPATLDRAEIAALLGEGTSHQLWFDLAVEGEGDPYRLTVELSDDDLRAVLAGAAGDEVLLALDGQEVAGALEEPDVEAHGLRGALAISLAVATTAIAAPAGMAATQPAVSPATSTQSISAATTQQAVGAAATTQVVRQIASQQLRLGAKAQRVSPLKLNSLTILRAGAVR